jgi:hypothetical protein
MHPRQTGAAESHRPQQLPPRGKTTSHAVSASSPRSRASTSPPHRPVARRLPTKSGNRTAGNHNDRVVEYTELRAADETMSTYRIVATRDTMQRPPTR